MRAVSLILLGAVVACGGGDSTPDAAHTGDASHVDAPHTIDSPHSDAPDVDAPPATVIAVACGSGSAAAVVTAPGFMYVSTPAGSASNNSEITVNQIVEFNLVQAADHPVIPDPSASSDPGLRAATGSDTCLQFTAPGTFHYECMVHGFKGSVTVSQ